MFILNFQGVLLAHRTDIIFPGNPVCLSNKFHFPGFYVYFWLEYIIIFFTETILLRRTHTNFPGSIFSSNRYQFSRKRTLSSYQTHYIRFSRRPYVIEQIKAFPRKVPLSNRHLKNRFS